MITESDEDFWRRVHAALDRGEDPLDDPAVVAALEARPDLLDQHAHLVQALRALPLARRPRRRVRRVRRVQRVAAALAAFALAAGVAWLLWPEPGAAAPPRGEVCRVWSLRVVHRLAHEEESFEQRATGERRERVALVARAPLLRQVIDARSYDAAELVR